MFPWQLSMKKKEKKAPSSGKLHLALHDILKLNTNYIGFVRIIGKTKLQRLEFLDEFARVSGISRPLSMEIKVFSPNSLGKIRLWPPRHPRLAEDSHRNLGTFVDSRDLSPCESNMFQAYFIFNVG